MKNSEGSDRESDGSVERRLDLTVAHIGKGQKVARLCRTSVQHPLGKKKDDGDTKAQYSMKSMTDDMYMIDRGQASARLAQSGLRRVAGSCPS
jgi:hypothetical protein